MPFSGYTVNIKSVSTIIMSKPYKQDTQQRSILSFVIVIVLVGAAIWVLTSVGKDKTEEATGTQDADIAGVQTAPADEADLFDLQEPEPKYTEDDPEYNNAVDRDTQRLANVQTIMEALEKHLDEVGSYPESINDLVPRYIDALPTGPNDDDQYLYTPIGRAPYTFFDLTYTLEIGTDDITPGAHTASPGAIVSL